jgi:hypothetical protein
MDVYTGWRERRGGSEKKRAKDRVLKKPAEKGITQSLPPLCRSAQEREELPSNWGQSSELEQGRPLLQLSAISLGLCFLSPRLLLEDRRMSV